ncbi:MAG: AMP-binding protein, partial [Acidimicrobiales bacterium]|nr:AMP-binding protein [Acidimicrobiales bacterium]
MAEATELMSMAARLGGLDPFFNSARALAVARWGAGISAMVAASATRYPRRAAVVDHRGSIDYATLDRYASNIGGLLRTRASSQLGDGTVGILCRNHRGFVLAQVGAERAGRDVVMLSTALPQASLLDVVAREHIDVIIADLEFADLVEPIVNEGSVRVVFADSSEPGGLEALAAERRRCPPPTRRGRLVILTSGTTGPPKGARRDNKAPGLDALSMFAKVPYRAGGQVLVCPPLFHAWGLSQATIALSTASTLHLRPKFEVESTIGLMRSTRFDAVAVVPLMLKRMLRSPEISDIRRPRLVLSSGNVLSGDVALEWMDRFGDTLYNFYGSTEAALG